jgi:hypothetical protein
MIRIVLAAVFALAAQAAAAQVPADMRRSRPQEDR